MFSPLHCWFIFFVLRKEQEKNSFLFFPFHCGGPGGGWGLAHSGLVPQSTCVPSWGHLVRSILAMVQGRAAGDQDVCWVCSLVIWLQVVSWWASWGYQTVTVSGMKDANIFLFILFMGFSSQDYWSCLPTLDESEKGEWKSWLKTKHSKNEDHSIRPHHFMANRWGNSGNSERLYFLRLQNHCRWWLQPWN